MSLRSFFLAAVFSLTAMVLPVRAADEPPLSLAREGWFYVGGHCTLVFRSRHLQRSPLLYTQRSRHRPFSPRHGAWSAANPTRFV